MTVQLPNLSELGTSWLESDSQVKQLQRPHTDLHGKHHDVCQPKKDIDMQGPTHKARYMDKRKSRQSAMADFMQSLEHLNELLEGKTENTTLENESQPSATDRADTLPMISPNPPLPPSNHPSEISSQQP